MKALLTAVGLSLMAYGLSAQPVSQSAENVPEIPFVSVANFFKLPARMYFGEVASIAIDSRGHFYVLSRGNVSGSAFAPRAAQVLEFDKDGNYEREIARSLYTLSFPHAIRIDKQDRIWIADPIAQTVTQLHLDNTLGLVFGIRPQSGYPVAQGPINHLVGYAPAVEGRLQGPSATVVDSQGNLYVAEGYGNNRVAVFDKNGTWVRSFGSRGRGPDQFETLIDIAIDAQDNIYLADRGNKRILVYDPRTWTLLRQFSPMKDIPYPRDIKAWVGNTPPPPGNSGRAPGEAGCSGCPPGARSEGAPGGRGAPWALCITPGPGQQYLFAADAFPGRIYKMTLEGKVLGMLGRSGRQLGEFGWPSGIACPSENEIYVADQLNFRAQKLLLNPQAASSK